MMPTEVEIIIWVVITVVLLLIVMITGNFKSSGEILKSCDFKLYVKAVRGEIEGQDTIFKDWRGYPEDVELLGFYKDGYQPEIAAAIWRKDIKHSS